MPDVTLSQALEEAYASAPSNEIIMHTLEFRHPSFTEPLRVVRDVHDFNARIEAGAPANAGEIVTFVGFAFDLTLPDVTSGASPEVTITIDNVSRDVLAYMDLASNSADLIEVTYRPYLYSDPTTPQIDPPLTLVIREVEADVFSITARAGFGDYANRRFPNELYNAQRFPGLTSL